MINSTEENKKLFLKLFKRNAGNISQACEATGINRRTYYNWIHGDENFRDEVEEVYLSLVDMAESKLFKNIVDGKETSLIFFLTNRAPDKWKHKDILRVEQKTGVFVNTGDMKELSEKIKESFKDESGNVAERIAEALRIGLPQSSPRIEG